MTPLQFRQAAFDNGYLPVPVKTGQKWPITANWTEVARAQRRPTTVYPRAASTGILCDGLRAVDVDIDTIGAALTVKQLAVRMLGRAPTRVRPGTPRCLMLYHAALGEPRKLSITGDRGKVEVLGLGQQFVADGEHPDGGSYSWPEGGPAEIPRRSLPSVTEDAIIAFLDACRPVIGAPPPPRVASVPSHPAYPVRSMSRYARAVLIAETETIAGAPNGEQEFTLNASAFKVGRRVAEGKIGRLVAEQALIAAGMRMRNFNPSRPWSQTEVTSKVKRALDQAATRVAADR